MHILFLSHYFPPEGNAPASRVYSLCKNWTKSGHQVTVITSAPNVPNGIVYEGYRNKIYSKELIDGISVIRVWTYLSPNKGSSKRIFNYISYMFSSVFWGLFVSKPDIVISTSPQFFCGWAGLILSKMKFKKNILEIRDIWPDSITAVGAMSNPFLLKFLSYLENKMYRWSSKIVTVGDGYKKVLIEKGVQSDKISIITNGLDQDQFYPMKPDQNIIKTYNLENKFVCSYIGTIGMACGLEVVLNAARLLEKKSINDIHFLLIGDGAQKSSLERRVITENIKFITFTGLIKKSNVIKMIATSSTCLVHLKKTKLFSTVLPSKIFEAFGMKKSIILGVDGEANKLIQKSKSGIYMTPDDPESLIEKILYLKGNPNIRKSMEENGYNYVRKHFDREILAMDYLNIIINI